MARVLKWLAGLAAAVLVLAVAAFFLLMRALSGDASEDEVARAPAPDGRVEAVLLETNGGATTSFGYEVHIVPPGAAPGASEVAFLYGTLRNTNAYGANLRWLAPDQLRVEYWTTQRGELKQPAVQAGGRTISVSLQSGVLDESAPDGGMLYNLGKKP